MEKLLTFILVADYTILPIAVGVYAFINAPGNFWNQFLQGVGAVAIAFLVVLTVFTLVNGNTSED